MRKPALIAVVLASSAALALTACGGSDSKNAAAKVATSGGGNELHIYAWSGEITDSMVKAFTAKTGIKVTIDTYDSNETMTAKLASGAGGYDLVEPSQYTVQQLIGQNLIAKLDKSQLTGMDNLATKFQSTAFDNGDNYSIPLIWGTTGLAYNAKCTGTPITSFQALFDAKYKGKIYMLDNMLSSYIPALQVNGFHANSTDPAQIEKATKTLLAQKPLLAGYNSSTTADLLNKGQACVAEMYNGSAIAKVTAANPDVHYVIPSEGGTLWTDSLAIPAKAKNITAAYKFINFVLQPEVAAMETNDGGNASTNQAARQYIKDKSVLENPAIYASDAAIEKSDFILDPGTAIKYFNQGWTQVRAS